MECKDVILCVCHGKAFQAAPCFSEEPGIPGPVFITLETSSDILPGPTLSQESPPFVQWRNMGPKIEVCHFFRAHLYMISELLWSEVTTNVSTKLQLNPCQKAAAKCNSPPNSPIKWWNYIMKEKNDYLTQQQHLDLCIFHLFFMERLYWDIYLWRSECFNWFIKQITLIFSVDFISSHNANSLEITVTNFMLLPHFF